MLRIGLTGNVAAGKSAVAGLFRDWGAVVIDADVLARQAVAPGTPGLAAVLARFPAADDGTGALDRGALRRHVLADPAEREALNAIVHPEVRRLRAAAEADALRADATVVVHDIPLLFEVLDPAEFDGIVLVDADVAERRRRLRADRGLSAVEADALIAAQWPAETKRARSTWIIENDGTRQQLAARARTVWRELQERARAV